MRWWKTLTSALGIRDVWRMRICSRGRAAPGRRRRPRSWRRCIECVNGPTSHPDNTCENCRAILEGTALDVLEIDAASNRGIDEIRALRDAVKFAPATMRSKVYIIDEAHMLTKEGANPSSKRWKNRRNGPCSSWPRRARSAAADDPVALPALRVPAHRDPDHDRADARDRRRRRITIDDAALAAIAYRADGGLRDALTMLEQVFAFAGGPVDAAVVDAAFGTTGHAFARALRDATLDGDAAGAAAHHRRSVRWGRRYARADRSTIAEFRHLLVARVNPDLLARDLSEADARIATERAALVPQGRLVRGASAAGRRARRGARLGKCPARIRERGPPLHPASRDPTLEALGARMAALESGAPPATPRVRPANPGRGCPGRPAASARRTRSMRPSRRRRPNRSPRSAPSRSHLNRPPPRFR